MGCMPKLCSSDSTNDPQSGNPDPSKYTIVRYTHYDDIRTQFQSLVVEIKYTGCTNYEGRKILVYAQCEITIDKLLKQGLIDPHFTDDETHISPIARFVPTAWGWKLANKLATSL